MQPTYLPWAGYFHLMARVDDFVFLDDVQFERRSWQSRNRVLLDGREHLLTVPVRKATRDARIDRIEVNDDEGWRDAHARILQAAYAKAPFGAGALQPLLAILADRQLRWLADLNIRIATVWRDLLGLPTRLHRARDLDCPGARSEHLARICERIGTDDYFSPAGSLPYLQEDNFESRYGKRLVVASFDPPAYPQKRAPAFVSHLSLLDVLAHLGPAGARSYVLGGTP